jgi:hypothetical protein
VVTLNPRVRERERRSIAHTNTNQVLSTVHTPVPQVDYIRLQLHYYVQCCSIKMSDPFDPFSLDDDAFDTSAVNTSKQSDVNKSKQSDVNKSIQSNDSTFFDSSFLPGNFSSPLDETFDDKHSPAKVKQNSHDLDSDIYSQLFMSPSQLAGAGTNTIISNASEPSGIAKIRNATNTLDSIAKDLKPVVKPHIVQISVVLHEEMSVIYDSEPNSALQGKTFYIALSDPDKQFQQVSSFFEVAKEVTDHLKEDNPFVKRNQELGNRIYRVEIPRNSESLGSKPINLIKYTGSAYLRPIPLVSKVHAIHYRTTHARM